MSVRTMRFRFALTCALQAFLSGVAYNQDFIPKARAPLQSHH
jgi:hypothetical protein